MCAISYMTGANECCSHLHADTGTLAHCAQGGGSVGIQTCIHVSSTQSWCKVIKLMFYKLLFFLLLLSYYSYLWACISYHILILYVCCDKTEIISVHYHGSMDYMHCTSHVANYFYCVIDSNTQLGLKGWKYINGDVIIRQKNPTPSPHHIMMYCESRSV